MRNDLLNTARHARIEEPKGYKDAQGHQESNLLGEVRLSDAVETVFDTYYSENLR
jgi:hypothetical protein